MIKNYLFIWVLSLVSCVSISQVTTTPSPPEANAPVTIFFNKAGTGLATYNGTIYAHTGVTVNSTNWSNVIGQWGQNTVQPALTLVSGTTYKLEITPDLYTYYGVSTSNSITQICIVFRSDTGGAQSTDFYIPVGAFQATLTAPVLNGTTIVNSGGSLAIAANNTNGNANYNLLANGVSINNATTANYSFTDTNITANKNYELQIVQGTTTHTRKFAVVVNPGTVTQTIPAGLVDGINYNASDATKATLVLTAPGKDFVYVAGSFNGFNPTSAHAMKKDGTSGKFWLELTGLTAGQYAYYQYWVVDTTPTTNSPALVKTADPYSTLVVNPYDDPYIPATSYPNMPVFPAGQDRDVTVLQTGQTPYNWQVTNFVKPKKEDLVIYELLVRDFDANRRYQDVIDRIDYFKNLKINAIELMPVMEFEGNESWGYNTSFHMALDKFYGSAAKLKELVDLCHQNGIAVILDVALNHAFGRNPMVRMWMKDPDGDGWGEPAADNPYFNEVARHSYSVGNDFNHSSLLTKEYVYRVQKQWIQEFKIDGFRWDLTKGFTQLCTASDETCTNGSPADRVPILKDYVDYSWSLDPTHYAIFEHLGNDTEEKQWADYRLNETPSKGVMMWGEMAYQYSQLAKGYPTDGVITRVGHVAHNFAGKRLIGYPESHDKERMVYGMMTYGNGAGASPPLNNLNNSLGRMSSIGATSLLVPGPKMIWHFAELGYDDSIYTCNNGTVNDESGVITGDCKLDTKPQEQWTNNWLGVTQRAEIYNNYKKMIQLKIQEPVFEGNYDISPDANNIRQRIYVYDNSLPATQLRNVVVIANFSVAAQSINPSFPYTGTWYNLMDNTPMTVTNATATISVPAGQFRVYGNQPVSLSADQFDTTVNMALYPNPASSAFAISADVAQLQVFSVTGQLVKTFQGQSIGTSYDISDLTRGVYFVKATDEYRREKTMKLVKE
ncbi:MAG: T9SS type A sorting domain-containing protein [Flavobacterium sp.]|uniref:alpha-amylase family glycosyl hydrolase n=1 Tax=Flavobacterium sp. TaxID=239 RepID=UPI0011FDEF75|nr:alpha-amylase family glycosyl hydrolase [Flavobacterium sp.]RZJ66727.1 MAG: T9SS type A sorting domain-containing protein [Flavobacterium sp.]